MSPRAFLCPNVKVVFGTRIHPEEGHTMSDSKPVSVDRFDARDPRCGRPGALTALLTIQEVAGLLNCSTRTVYRLNDAGRIPRPVRLGALLRWSRPEFEHWLAAGCPVVKGGRR